jgi:hypothetical protein
MILVQLGAVDKVETHKGCQERASIPYSIPLTFVRDDIYINSRRLRQQSAKVGGLRCRRKQTFCKLPLEMTLASNRRSTN